MEMGLKKKIKAVSAKEIFFSFFSLPGYTAYLHWIISSFLSKNLFFLVKDYL